MEESAAPMSNTPWVPLGIIVQSFAVFVAISILLGRIYSESYFGVLGIPTSEIRLSVTDYAVVSPEVTVVGIGLSAILAIIFMSNISSVLNAVSRWAIFWSGSVILALGVGITIWIVNFLPQQHGLNSLQIVILALWPIALMSFGAVMLGSILDSFVLGNPQNRSLWKLMTPLMALLYISVFLWLSSQFAYDLGETKARVTWATAPLASIGLASPSAYGALEAGLDECSADLLGCRFRVILIGDKFVYLRPLNTESLEERLFAVPVGDIASITYVLEGNDQGCTIQEVQAHSC